jgi:hypothetical protein
VKRSARWIVAFVSLVVTAIVAGCYDPSIGDGTLGCADGGICPRGFSCGGDRRCWRSPVPDAHDAGHVDSARADTRSIPDAAGGGHPAGGGAGAAG